jgi:hypothetical protein
MGKPWENRGKNHGKTEKTWGHPRIDSWGIAGRIIGTDAFSIAKILIQQKLSKKKMQKKNIRLVHTPTWRFKPRTNSH